MSVFSTLRNSTVILFLLALLAIPAGATTRYVAQSAGTFSGGSACNGQTAITLATWNSTSESAGDVAYVCGTITVSAGASGFVFPSNGASGNPNFLIFDSGASIQAPYFSHSDITSECTSSCGGAIDENGKTYWIIDGGSNGYIQATAAGTSLANQASSEGISIYGSNIIVRNVLIKNLYLNQGSSSGATDVGGYNSVSIRVSNSATNITLCNNTLNNSRIGISSTGSDSGSTLVTDCSSNTFGTGLNYFNNALDDHAWFIQLDTGPSSAAHPNTYGNLLGGAGSLGATNWQYPTGTYHTNGIFAQNQSALLTMYSFNNLIEIDIGVGSPTGLIACGGANPGVGSGGQIGYCFNNLVIGIGSSKTNAACSYLGNAQAGETDGPNYIYNNTYMGCQFSFDMVGDTSTDWHFENNAYQHPYAGGQWYYHQETTNQPWATILVDYNVYDPANSPNWNWNGTVMSSFTTWKSTCNSGGGAGCDAHGQSCALNINSATYIPNTGSCLIASGANLTSLCAGQLAPLCYDAPLTFGVGGGIEGTARPSSSAWPVGAYQPSSGGGITISPSTLPNGFVGSAYSQSLIASGGTGPYTYAVTSGSLAACNVSLGAGGIISGTPNAATACSATVTATDSLSATGSQAYTLTISATPQTSGGAFQMFVMNLRHVWENIQ